MPGNRPIQVIQRVSNILYAIAGVEGGCSVTQLSRITGIKVATLHRIVRSLQIEGFLTRLDRPTRYTLGPAIVDLNRLHQQQHLLTVCAEEMIRAHATLISANLVLVVPQDHVCYQRLRCTADQPGRISRLRNSPVEPYIRASSLVCLAYATTTQSQAFYEAHPFEKEGRDVWKTRQNLEEFLAKVRHEGLAIPPIPDLVGVAVPILSPNRELIAVVEGSMPLSTEPRKPQKLVHLCQTTSQAIMRRLGIKPTGSTQP
jgi:DNA-binding IclR family transcriptional regulator